MYSKVLVVSLLTDVLETYLAFEHPESSVEMRTYPQNTYNFVTFGDKVQTLALGGLWGCTAVFVVSRKGAWLGHFWEADTFSAHAADSDYFRDHILNALDTGNPGEFIAEYVNEYAIGDLRNKNDKGDLGHMFDDNNKPHIYIAAPRARVWDFDTWSWSNNPDAGHPDVLMYPDHTAAIQAKLREMFPAAPNAEEEEIDVLDYAPMTQGDKWDTEYDTYRGKVLIQYQPSPKVCDQSGGEGPPLPAKWRVWFQAEGKRYP